MSPGHGIRIAVVSSPRSGNTWLRRLLARAYGADEIGAHAPAGVPWTALPDRAILQLHWRPEQRFRSLLDEHGFSVVTLARHPIDVLVSVLHFSRYAPQTREWLAGEGGDESAIDGAAPVSPAFEAYATGPRARALLCVSQRWWVEDGVQRVRYEELWADPVAALERLAAGLSAPPVEAPADAVARTQSAEQVRTGSGNFHSWSGVPGGWRRFVPASLAAAIGAAHADVLETLGYDVDADPELTPDAAEAAWWRGRVAALEDERAALRARLTAVTAEAGA